MTKVKPWIHDLWIARIIGIIFIVLGIAAPVWIVIQSTGREWYLVIPFYSATPIGMGVLILIGAEIIREMRER